MRMSILCVYGVFRILTDLFVLRSSKSALHGLVHWLAGAYAKKGITVNGVAPALIEDTKMLPGASAELSASKFRAPSSG